MPHNTFSPTLPDHSPKDNVDALLLHTVSKLKRLIRCSKERTSYQHLLLPSLSTFVKHMSIQCRLSSTVLVVALIYLARLEQNLPTLACGGKCSIIISRLDKRVSTHNMARIEYDTPYKIFLASILLASKYIDDSSFVTKTIHRTIAPLYTSRDVADMERSFLGVVKVMPWSFTPYCFAPIPLAVTPKLTLFLFFVQQFDLYVDLAHVSGYVQDHLDHIVHIPLIPSPSS